MNRCRLCVMPDTRPDTPFVDGICAACIAYFKRPRVDWQEREAMLQVVLERARERARHLGNSYDLIVPSSGGKDSHYQVLELKRRGARVLVVTASTCHLSVIGRQNIDNLARHATTIEATPNRSVRATLNRKGLELVGDISWPEHVAIFTVPIRAARALGIPYIFYGENPQNQYGGPILTQDAFQMSERWRSEFGGFLGLRPADLVGQDGITAEDMADYTLPEGAWYGLEAHFLGQYLPWDSHHNARVAAKAGMRQERPSSASWWTHENLDNAQTGLHDHLMYLKYGYGRGCAQISVDVRTDRITRETAMEWVQMYDHRLPMVYAGVPIDEMLERIGMTVDGFQKAASQWKARR